MEADRLILAIDFDGTIIKSGPDNYKLLDFELMPNAETVLKDLYNKTYLILWTNRTGPILQNALDFLNKHGIKFHKINENVDNLGFQTSAKIYAEIYFDDRGHNTKIDWLKFKRHVEKEMKKNKISTIADEIIQKVAVIIVKEALTGISMPKPYEPQYPLHKQPHFKYRQLWEKEKEPVKPQLSELKKDILKAEDDIKRTWEQISDVVIKSLKEKKKTPELEEFQNKVKEIVVKRGLPDNMESVKWLDKYLKNLTQHNWLIPGKSFNKDVPTTILAFKSDEMKK